jgi:hypothetical protein
MARMSDEWTVRAHGPIEKLSENLWLVSGGVPGMSLKRVMTVARLGDGRLVVHSAIALDQAGMAALEAWGTPAFLLVPGRMHRLDAPAYKRRYPGLKVLAPRGSRRFVEELLPVDGSYEDFVADETVRLTTLPGIQDLEGAMLVRSADGITIVVNDAVFNMDRRTDPLGWFFTTVMGSAPGPRISRLFKLLAVRDKQAFRGELERLAATPSLVRLIVAHDKVASGAEAAAALRRAATYL